MWAGGLAESSIPPQTPENTPKSPQSRLFDPHFTFLDPKSRKNPGVCGWFHIFGINIPKTPKKVFLWLSFPTTIYVAYNSALPSFSAFLCIRVFQIAHLVIWVPLPEECALSCVSKVSALLLGFCSFLPIRNIV